MLSAGLFIYLALRGVFYLGGFGLILGGCKPWKQEVSHSLAKDTDWPQKKGRECVPFLQNVEKNLSTYS
jgi:hypothetical protein